MSETETGRETVAILSALIEENGAEQKGLLEEFSPLQESLRFSSGWPEGREVTLPRLEVLKGQLIGAREAEAELRRRRDRLTYDHPKH